MRCRGSRLQLYDYRPIGAACCATGGVGAGALTRGPFELYGKGAA